jgi:hypothetical protein
MIKANDIESARAMAGDGSPARFEIKHNSAKQTHDFPTSRTHLFAKVNDGEAALPRFPGHFGLFIPVVSCSFSTMKARVVVLANVARRVMGRRRFFLTHNRRASLTLGGSPVGKSRANPTSAQVLL